MIIKMSQFAKERHVPEKEFSHFDGDWSEIEKLAEESFENAREGYRDGVLEVPVNPYKFYSSIVPRDTNVNGSQNTVMVYEPRRPGEEPVYKTVTYGIKKPALFVDLILYRKDVLEEDPMDRDQLTGADWEIVSINARTTAEEVPMTPMTMARNQLADDPKYGKGGTKGEFTPEQFARSIMFWNEHVMVREERLYELK